MEEKAAAAIEVNRLYWDTDDSVAEISNRLNVSRRAMYEMIEPMAAGIECASCGAELYYNNRSARGSGVARCLVCGKERAVDVDMSHEDVGMIPPYSAGWPATGKRTDDHMRERTAMIAGFAIAGVVVGAIATILVRRNR